MLVCLGNICRSPLCEGILKKKIKERGLDWTVSSSGTSSWHAGDMADHRSIEVALKNGIDLSSFRSKQFTKEHLEEYDHILTMDSSNYTNVLNLAKDEELASKVSLLMNYAYPGKNMQVPDPYYYGGFDKVYEMMDLALERFLDRYGS